MARTLIPNQQNLIINSEDFSAASWNANNLITVATNQIAAPDTTVTADLLTANGGVSKHYCCRAITVPAAYQFSPRRVSVSCFYKAGNTDWVLLGNERHTDFVFAWFNVTTGALGSVTADNPTAIAVSSRIQSAVSAQFPSAPAGWYLCSMTYVMISPAGGAGMTSESIMVGPTSANNVSDYDGAGAQSCYAWGAAMAIGSNWTGQYAKTTSAQINTGSLRSLP
jgi:hypothetical protein